MRAERGPTWADASERALLLSTGAFDPVHYAGQSGLPPSADLLIHYLETGWKADMAPFAGFDGGFLAPFYAATGLDGPPLLIWRELSARAGRLPTSLAQAEPLADLLRASDVFDPAWYATRLPDGLDPALHYVVAGEAAGWRLSPGFDAAYYLERHPELATAGVSPFAHWVAIGRAEGRRTRSTMEVLALPAIEARDRPVVLLLVHEASRSGAPLLGWNLIRQLSGGAAVVAVVLRDGPLLAAFASASAAVVGPLHPDDWHAAEMARLAARLASTYRPAYAIANSVATGRLVPHLAMRGVPSVALVHEFSSYMERDFDLSAVFDWAAEIVFPAQMVAESAYEAVPALRSRRGLHVFAQGRVDVPGAPPAVAGADGPGPARAGSSTAGFVVLGAGQIELRKGFDVFVGVAAACARQAPELDIRFVWVGAIPEPDMAAYSVFVREQIVRSGVAERVRIMAPVSDLEPVYAGADLFLLSSRLDPQPNVAIDALSRGLPVLCFEQASGTAELLGAEPATRTLVVPYLDAAAAAAAICALARDPARHARLRESVRRLASERFDMAGYAARIDGLGRAAAARPDARDLATLRDARLDIDMVVPAGLLPPGSPELGRIVQAQWAAIGSSPVQGGSRWFLRGEAGFHPLIHAARHPDCAASGTVPLAHWLRAGRPPGPWARPQIMAAARPPEPRLALHVHLDDPALLAEAMDRLPNGEGRPDLFVTGSTQAAVDRLGRLCAGLAGVRRVSLAAGPDGGCGALLALAGDLSGGPYRALGHVHDGDLGDGGRTRRRVLWDRLLGTGLGSVPVLDWIAAGFAGDPALGLVVAEEPQLPVWTEGRAQAEAIAARFGWELPPDGLCDGPAGCMVWVRPQALAPLLGLDERPARAALARLVPLAVQAAGYSVAGIRV